VLPLKTLLDEENSIQEGKLYESIVALEEGAHRAGLQLRQVEEL